MWENDKQDHTHEIEGTLFAGVFLTVITNMRVADAVGDHGRVTLEEQDCNCL